MTQRRMNKKSLKFGSTMTRNGKTLYAPKGFKFHYDSSATGDKVNPKKKLWWRLTLDIDPKNIYDPETIADSLPTYVWSNFKKVYDFLTLRRELKIHTTSKQLAESYHRWRIEDPEIPILERFLDELSPIIPYDPEAKSLRFAIDTGDATGNMNNLLSAMKWRDDFPTHIDAPKIIELNAIKINGKLNIWSRSPFGRDTRGSSGWLAIPTDPEDTAEYKTKTITEWKIEGRKAELREFLRRRLSNLDLNIETLNESEGVGTILSMNLRSQENIYKAREKLNKVQKQSEELLDLMNESKYDKKKLKELLAAIRDLQNFFKSWTNSRASLPWK